MRERIRIRPWGPSRPGVQHRADQYQPRPVIDWLTRTSPPPPSTDQPSTLNDHDRTAHFVFAHRTDRLGCRWVLEDLEKKMSALRQRQPKASRAAVWRDVFASDPAFYKKMLRAADLGQCAVVAPRRDAVAGRAHTGSFPCSGGVS